MRTVFAILAALVMAGAVASTLVTMRVTVDASGTVEPRNLWAVRSAESGIVRELLVRTGEWVAVGQAVALLDSLTLQGRARELEMQLRVARLDLERMEARVPIADRQSAAELAAAELRVGRARNALRLRLLDFGLAVDPDSVAAASGQRVHVGFDGVSADLLAAQADLLATQARIAETKMAAFDIRRKELEIAQMTQALATARTMLARQVLRAPATGVVLTERLEDLIGSVAVAGQLLIEIADTSRWQVVLVLPEGQFNQVAIGNAVQVEIPALSRLDEQRMDGVVASLSWQPMQLAGAQVAAASASANAQYRVVVELDSVDAEAIRPYLRRGYAVTAKIVTRSDRIASIIRDKLATKGSVASP